MPRSGTVQGKPVKRLAGGNPQIAKGDGDAPVRAYLAAMPGWKRDVGRRLDALIERLVPGVRRAVRWNSPFYGVEGGGWFVAFHVFTRYVKVTFFDGTSLRPVPPGGRGKDARWIDLHEDDFDEARLTAWIRQAAALPGWGGAVAKRRAEPSKRPERPAGESASRRIDRRIVELGGWRGETLARMRRLILEADPDMTEEWKWDVPVWSHDGIVCTGEAYAKVVKLTFARGAAIPDPSRLFNASLKGNTRRAIDLREGETIDARAFKSLVKAAVAGISSARHAKRPPGKRRAGGTR